jgi:L-rhamnose-H+ transport protein
MFHQIVETGLELAAKVALFGMLWGLGSVLFGISLVRLGMAVTNGLVSGVVVFLGSLGPLIIGTVHIDFRRLVWLLLGLFLLVMSLLLWTLASVSRDKAQGSAVPSGSQGSKLAIVVAILSGILSSMLNIGFAFGVRFTEQLRLHAYSPVMAALVVWIPALLGGLLPNVGYPAYLLSRGRNWGALMGRNGNQTFWLRSSLMGLLWFSGILIYGYGTQLMGNTGTVYGWALYAAASLMTSNIWGVATGEWKGTGSKPRLLMVLATVVLLLAFSVLSVAQSLN